MIPNGIYGLTIVEAEPCPAGLRIAFDVEFEDERISKIFSTARPAESLRELLESCGRTIPYRRVRLHLDTLIGMGCLGLVVGGQVIEFYSQHVAGWDFMNTRLSEVPNYVM